MVEFFSCLRSLRSLRLNSFGLSAVQSVFAYLAYFAVQFFFSAFFAGFFAVETRFFKFMIGDGILPGDKVLLRPNVQVQNGEIAAVHIGDEYLATLKHVYFGPGRAKATLKASNPSYHDIVVAMKDVKVAGVFRGLVRTG